MKIFSQVSSYLYFLALVPVLRYGPNRRRFPFSDPPDQAGDAAARDQDSLDPKIRLQEDTLLDDGLQYLDWDSFWQAMLFACALRCGLCAGSRRVGAACVLGLFCTARCTGRRTLRSPERAAV